MSFILSSLLLTALGMDLISALSAVAACVGNIGPGLGDVGPAANYFTVPTAGKWILIFNMLLGRLEVYTVLLILSIRFWRT